MTMATIARHPGKFDAAVLMAGIYDFGDAYTNADRLGKVFIRTGHGGPPEERKEVYAITIRSRVKNITTPLLVMHGEADACSIPAIPARGEDPQGERQGLREQELSERAPRLSIRPTG
jgi:dipeptidyl aminopeptidase/acylaminoacyl peptidase